MIQDKSKTRFGKWIHDVAYSFVLNISYGLQSAAADTTVGVLLRERPLVYMRRDHITYNFNSHNQILKKMVAYETNLVAVWNPALAAAVWS